MHNRPFALIVAAVMSAALLWPVFALAAPAGARAATSVKVVVVVGPTHSLTDSNLQWGAAIAQRAAAHGAQVVTVFHPHATWSAVAAAAVGANVLIYLGHGNGFPSPYTSSLMGDRQDGMGLDPVDGAQADQVQYYGEQYMATLHLAPDALVILNHLCYASGNSEPGQPQPTTAVAIQRVDNFAAGFMAGGASAVLALGTQDAGDIVDGLFGPPQSLDQLFVADGGIGVAPITVASTRTPGARLHLDPDSATSGFYRSLAGNLDLLTSSVIDGGATAVGQPATQAGPASAGTTALPPVQPGTTSAIVPARPPALLSLAAPSAFTPNGDRVSDTLSVSYGLSAPSALDVSILSATGLAVRHMSVPAGAGSGRFTWDGTGDGGSVVPDGSYVLQVTPVGADGLAGTPGTVATRVLTAISAPRATPAIFYPLDGDGVADSTSLSMTLTQPATVTWTIEDAAGQTVRTLWDRQASPAGTWSVPWDGTGVLPGTSAPAPMPAGRYLSTISATTAAGTLLMRSAIWLQPFRLTPSRTSVAPGQVVIVTIQAAEPLRTAPRLTVSQPGNPAFAASVTTGGSAYRAVFRVRAGPAGTVVLRVVGRERTGHVVVASTTVALP
jgi:flagellar hook assembly protein FlgD